MSRKRSLVSDAVKKKKRRSDLVNDGASSSQLNGANCDDANDLPTDSHAALIYARDLFPIEKFEEELRRNGTAKMFSLGSESTEYFICLTEDYKTHVLCVAERVGAKKTVIEKFLTKLVLKTQDLSFSLATLMSEFTDDEITQLVRAGVLTARQERSWWLAIPNVGIYMKALLRGRKATSTVIRKCKYREILKSELEKRKLPKIARLGMAYHVLDIIGAELVTCIETTSGTLLRLVESETN